MAAVSGPRHRPERYDPAWATLRPLPAVDVLGVARTLTSATRLRDLVRLLPPQDVELFFTINTGSAFSAGLEEYVRSLPGRFLTWEEATAPGRCFDLAVAFAVHPSMREVDAPLMVLPHGVGYNRLVPEVTGGEPVAAGLSRGELTHEGRIVPAVIGVSHPEQLERLARSCPEALPRARVVGDLSYDRMIASLPRRDHYRRALGVTGARRLIVVNSTWRAHALLARATDLPLRLVTELPVDEYAVALVAHPNVWAHHTPAGVDRRLAQALDAGLMIIPPEEGWRAALVAADCVIGDHGSTSFLGAALGLPVLLAATGEHELDPSSPSHAFGTGGPRLDPDAPIEDQVRRAIENHDPETLRRITDGGLGAPGEAAARVRRTLYGFFAGRGVREPAGDAREALGALPDPPRRTAHTDAPGVCTFDVTGDRTDGVVTLRRFPVVARTGRTEPRGFLAVTDGETSPLWRQAAEVAARTVTDAGLPAADWLERRAADSPALLVATAALSPHRCLLRLRDGRLLEAETVREWGRPRPELHPLVLGAAVNLWQYGGGGAAELVTGGLLIRTGAAAVRVRFVPQDRTGD